VATLDRRIGFLFAAFLVLLALGFARALELGTLNRSHLTQVAAIQQVSNDVVLAQRGTIVDRHGVSLAISEPAGDISANPRLIKDPNAVAAKIAPILNQTRAELVTKLVKTGTGFVYLQRELPAAEANRIKALKIEGISVDPTELRTYPHDLLASQVLGMVGTDHSGLAGIEYSRNRILAGTNGRRRIVRDAHGQSLGVQDSKLAIQGAKLELTLDASIQEQAEQVLKAVGSKYSPKFATAIVMDPRSNEILALANWPRVDANDPGHAPASALQDHAVATDFEPGSTFKAFTVAGALSEGKITPDSRFYVPSKIQVADRTINDAEDHADETLTTAQILQQSSNVGAIKIGATLGRYRFDDWVHRFGFGKATGVDLPGEERGQVLPAAKYSGASMGNLPIGQGLSVTPLQIATAYSAIANGGILRKPHVVRRINGRLVHEPKGRRVISPEVSAQLRTMLEGVLAPGGTASEVSIPPFILAGKTGTANKVDPKTGKYSDENFDASFVGFAPAKHPRLLVAVVVDEPRGDHMGGSVAAPAFGEIARFALPYLRIAP
jgi:cell division protein FtsI/penicillin-binding protein 2